MLEWQIVVAGKWRVIERRRPGEWRRADRRRTGRTGSAATSLCGRRVGTGPASRWPDDAFTAGSSTLLRLVLALEIRRLWIPLRQPVVPHCAATDRACRHTIPRGDHRLRGLVRGSYRARGVARRPDDSVALAVLALEIRCFGILLADAIVPHVARALRA